MAPKVQGLSNQFEKLSDIMEITLALIKPHVLRNTYAMQQIRALIAQNFTVLDQKEVHITKELSAKFYEEHRGKFFYHRLTSFMNR